MNRIKYRACILVVLVIAIAFGIWYYVNGAGEEQEPFAGATLVWMEEGSRLEISREKQEMQAVQAVVRLDETLSEKKERQARASL